MEFNLIAAIDIARRAHEGQKRKYTGEPYIVHPFAVAGLVASVTDNNDMLCAAILHDVVEDSAIKIQVITGILGGRIAGMVLDLTDVSTPEDGNRKARKKIDLDHTANATDAAKTIKLADLIDNTKTITAFDPKFAAVYMEEKRRLLEVLHDGDKVLFKMAKDLVENYFSAV